MIASDVSVSSLPIPQLLGRHRLLRSEALCSRGERASVGLALMNEPTPRRVSMTPARSSSAYTRATVLAFTRSSTAS